MCAIVVQSSTSRQRSATDLSSKPSRASTLRKNLDSPRIFHVGSRRAEPRHNHRRVAPWAIGGEMVRLIRTGRDAIAVTISGERTRPRVLVLAPRRHGLLQFNEFLPFSCSHRKPLMMHEFYDHLVRDSRRARTQRCSSSARYRCPLSRRGSTASSPNAVKALTRIWSE